MILFMKRVALSTLKSTVIIVAGVLFFRLAFSSFEASYPTEAIHYSDFITGLSQDEMNKYSNYYDLMDRKSIPLPIDYSDVKSSISVIDNSHYNIKESLLKSIESLGLEDRIGSYSGSIYDHGSALRVGITHPITSSVCLIDYKGKDLDYSYNGKNVIINSQFILYHELAHCYSSPKNDKEIKYPLINDDAKKSVFYSMSGGDKKLSKKLDKEYLKHHKEVFADLVASIIYLKINGVNLAFKIADGRENRALERADIAHWSSPLLRASKEDIDKINYNDDSLWDSAIKIFNKNISSMLTPEVFFDLKK